MAHESRFYTDYSSAAGNPGLQGFDLPGHEVFSLQAGIEMLGIPAAKNDQRDAHHNSNIWRGFIPAGRTGGGGGGSSSDFHRSDFSETANGSLMVAPGTETGTTTNLWPQPNRLLVDDSSLRCLFPSDGTDQPPPSRGLSLSLRHTTDTTTDAAAAMQSSHHLASNSRDGLFSKPITNLLHPHHHHHHHQQQLLLNDGRSFFSSSPPSQLQHQLPMQLKNSKYLIPAQELLTEFCNLGEGNSSNKPKPQKPSQWEEGGPSSSSSPWGSLDLLELQKRKTKLISMLEEVDRTYGKYREQMRAVAASFDAAAGEGTATVYSTLAWRAMSRHFRCLRDGIVGQIKATRKAMGEKDPIAPGTTRGETPRLKLLDQCVRQQKAFQQAGIMETHPWRPQRGLPERSVSVLRAWLFEHFLHPYPSDVDKHILARQTGLSRSQVSNWFINARVRLWKPMVEEMYLEELKEDDPTQSSKPSSRNEDGTGRPVHLLSSQNPNPNTSHLMSEDQKPIAGKLHDSDSLSSIINHSGKNSHHHQNFGVVDLDFSSYNDCGNQNFGLGGGGGGGGGGVSLTLGLQQHHGGGMSLSFSPASQQSLFFSRENMDHHCQQAQFSVIDGEAAQNLPYRNLMGSQMLHDLAG